MVIEAAGYGPMGAWETGENIFVRQVTVLYFDKSSEDEVLITAPYPT